MFENAVTTSENTLIAHASMFTGLFPGAHGVTFKDAGVPLHRNYRTLAEHFASLGTGLDRAVAAYNKTLGSLESRVLVAARRFTALGAAPADDFPEPLPIESTTRQPQAPELASVQIVSTDAEPKLIQ